MTPPNKWLFFPTQLSGALQTITFNMSGATTASSISSSGTPIISTTKVTELRSGKADGAMRLWNGTEAANGDDFSGTSGSGANIQYRFTSGTTCRAWWHQYAVSATINGGTAISLNATSSGGSGGGEDVEGSVDGSCSFGYVNCSVNINGGSAFSSGDTIVLTVTSV